MGVKSKNEKVICGSDTMVAGICTVCGARLIIKKKEYSKKQWSKIKHKYEANDSKE